MSFVFCLVVFIAQSCYSVSCHGPCVEKMVPEIVQYIFFRVLVYARSDRSIRQPLI